MPVRRRTKRKANAARDNPAVMEHLEDTLKASGWMSDEVLRDRIAELVVLDREFADDERREFKHLVRTWRRRRAHTLDHERRSAKAGKRWAAFSADERAEWERRAIESARRYDRDLTRGHATGEEFHYMHVVFQYDKRDRKEVKALERRQAKRAAEDAQSAQSAAQHAAAAIDDDEPTPAPKVARGALVAPAVAEPLEPTPPRRPRVRYGVVAEYDMHGRRVQ